MDLHNLELVDMLKSIARIRLCDNTERGKWSAKQHLNAAKILSLHPFEITSIDQVKSIPKIGEGITRKIDEYLNTGCVEELKQNTLLVEKSNIIGMFSSIPGVGFVTGRKWYEMGYRTQDDIKKAVKLGDIKLSKLQLIGLKYLDEISKKMTRKEMEEVADYVRNKLNNIEDNFSLKIVGSYRRGVQQSKDVDIIIYPDPNYHNECITVDGIIEDLLKEIEHDAIIFHSGDNNFMGLIESNGILRRIDVWAVPISELITTLVGRSSYVETNKKLRLEASKKGYKISNHGVYKRSTNEKIILNSEQELFDMFGVEKDYLENYIKK